MLLDNSYTQNIIPAVLSKIVGRPVDVGPYHVQLGLRPTLQRMRTAAEYASDFEQVGTQVEELEVIYVGRNVTRPPQEPQRR